MPTVEEGIQSQLRNIEKDYGRTIDELVLVVTGSGLTKHNEVVAMLKQRYGMSHGAAHRVSLVARGRAAPPAPASAGLAPPLQDVYARLLKKVSSLGNDVEQAPKKGYVSLRLVLTRQKAGRTARIRRKMECPVHAPGARGDERRHRRPARILASNGIRRRRLTEIPPAARSR
jgi:hypothetical protein